MRVLAPTLSLMVLVSAPALAETTICTPPEDQNVTVVCLSEANLTIHAANRAGIRAALQLVDKRPLPRPEQ